MCGMPLCLASQEWGQRALVAYVRSVFLAPAKEVFDVAKLPLEALAASWGLAAAPRMRFLRRVRMGRGLGGREVGGVLPAVVHTLRIGPRAWEPPPPRVAPAPLHSPRRRSLASLATARVAWSFGVMAERQTLRRAVRMRSPLA